MSAGRPRPGPTTRGTLVRAGNGFLDRWISFTRDYFVDLFEMVSGPKRFLASHRTSSEGALRFLAISFVLMFVMQLPLARNNPLAELIKTWAAPNNPQAGANFTKQVYNSFKRS